ncbi:ATP-binding cassette sub- D member 4 [Nowakowskiella sp. JEL0407]|nr:ATP-binding cassette sub- D member 4 [Nowakowskiella sp. JEL0407]
MEQLAIDPVLIVFYSYKTYTIANSIYAPLTIFLFFFLSAFLCRYLLNPIIRKVIAVDLLEGNFRAFHSSLITNAEQITLQNGATYEHENLASTFSALLKTELSLFVSKAILKFCTGLIDYGGTLLCYVIVAVPILTGKYDDLEEHEIAELVSKSLFYSLYLIYRLTLITKLSDRFSEIAGYNRRLMELLDTLNSVDAHHGNDPDHSNVSETTPLLSASNSPIEIRVEPISPTNDTSRLQITVSNLSFSTSQTTFKDITFDLKYPQNMLISGPSGSGKTMLVRVLAGLYPPKTGTINIPQLHSVKTDCVFCNVHENENFDALVRPEIMYFPQSPYLTLNATIAQQVAYPNIICRKCAARLYEARIKDLLKFVGLENLENSPRLRHVSEKAKIGEFVETEEDGEERVGEDKLNWKALSPGEKQRVLICRVLFYKPKIVVLDEFAGGLGKFEEERYLREFMRNDISVVLISHYWDDLDLQNGKWTVTDGNNNLNDVGERRGEEFKRDEFFDLVLKLRDDGKKFLYKR